MKHTVFFQKGKPVGLGAPAFAPAWAFSIAIVLILALAAGCRATKLSAAIDEGAVKQKAQDVIALLNAQDTKGIRGISTQTLNDALTDDTYTQIYSALEQGGAFVAVAGITVSGSTDKGTEYAVVVAQAKYEKKSFIYTISFDTDMKLAGIYYK